MAICLSRLLRPLLPISRSGVNSLRTVWIALRVSALAINSLISLRHQFIPLYQGFSKRDKSFSMFHKELSDGLKLLLEQRFYTFFHFWQAAWISSHEPVGKTQVGVIVPSMPNAPMYNVASWVAVAKSDVTPLSCVLRKSSSAARDAKQTWI